MAKRQKNIDLLKEAEVESEFFLKVEAQEIEPDENYLKKLHWDDLIEIKDLLNAEKEQKLIQKVDKALEQYEEPKIEIARLGERVWSFFYEKYFLRIFIAIYGLIIFIVSRKNLPLSDSEKNFYWLVFLGGAFLIIFLARIYLAFRESRQKEILTGSKIRRKLGLVVVQKDGYPPSFIKALLRGLFKSFPISFVTLLSMELNKKNRGIHDQLLKTYVLRINDQNITREEIVKFIEKNFSK